MAVSVDLCKLSDVVKYDVVKKPVYDELAAKVNNIGTSQFVLKTKHQTDKTERKFLLPKLTKLESKIPDVSSLATKTALTAVENKIPDVSSLVKKNNL